jgi:hypothetical protein
MTLAAVWRVDERVYSIADTRIIRSAGNVLTEHGPKILPITLVCKQPGPAGFTDRVAYAMTFGFAYAGSTLSALATHAFANTLCQNLGGADGSPPPDFSEVAFGIAEIAFRYMREIGELSGGSSLFSAVLFGFCIRADRFRAFELRPSADRSGLRIHLDEHDLYQPQKLIVIGSNPDLLCDRVTRDRPTLYADPNGALSPTLEKLREIDLPRRALSSIVAEELDPTIGGATQEAWVTRAGFEPVSKMVPIPRPAGSSGPNATMEVLGFDMRDFRTIGSYMFALSGR